eukprot:scaffold2864_cov77-Isochrysis_galbana.AAC.2
MWRGTCSVKHSPCTLRSRKVSPITMQPISSPTSKSSPALRNAAACLYDPPPVARRRMGPLLPAVGRVKVAAWGFGEEGGVDSRPRGGRACWASGKAAAGRWGAGAHRAPGRRWTAPDTCRRWAAPKAPRRPRAAGTAPAWPTCRQCRSTPTRGSPRTRAA